MNSVHLTFALFLALALAVVGSIVLLAMVGGAPLLVLYLGVLTVALLALSVALF